MRSILFVVFCLSLCSPVLGMSERALDSRKETPMERLFVASTKFLKFHYSTEELVNKAYKKICDRISDRAKDTQSDEVTAAQNLIYDWAYDNRSKLKSEIEDINLMVEGCLYIKWICLHNATLPPSVRSAIGDDGLVELSKKLERKIIVASVNDELAEVGQ